MAEVATVNSQGSTEVALRARAACETIKVAEPLCQSYNMWSNIADGCTTRLYPEVVGLQDATILTARCTHSHGHPHEHRVLETENQFHIRGGWFLHLYSGRCGNVQLATVSPVQPSMPDRVDS